MYSPTVLPPLPSFSVQWECRFRSLFPIFHLINISLCLFLSPRMFHVFNLISFRRNLNLCKVGGDLLKFLAFLNVFQVTSRLNPQTGGPVTLLLGLPSGLPYLSLSRWVSVSKCQELAFALPRYLYNAHPFFIDYGHFSEFSCDKYTGTNLDTLYRSFGTYVL